MEAQTNIAIPGEGGPSSRPEVLGRAKSALIRVPLDRVDDDDSTFRIRPIGDLSLLATDLARLGQLVPVELRLRPGDRYQPICGFRRLAALKFLHRDAVWARVHNELSDEDALLLAVASAIHSPPVTRDELAAFRARIESEGRLSPIAREMLGRALEGEGELGSESTEGEEVDTEELAEAVTLQLSELNQDLSLIADAFDSLDERHRTELMQQLRYAADLVAYLEGK